MTKLMSVAVLLIFGLGSVVYAEPQSVVAPLVPVPLAAMEQGQ